MVEHESQQCPCGKTDGNTGLRRPRHVDQEVKQRSQWGGDSLYAGSELTGKRDPWRETHIRMVFEAHH
ncbi:hypothetical protein, partial [Klebsiella pneumoniae]|uniref:hypothetical protein n=1 Tax=Klebsiella pneumoniae TaxID=573 RepID=UPI003134B222